MQQHGISILNLEVTIFQLILAKYFLKRVYQT